MADWCKSERDFDRVRLIDDGLSQVDNRIRFGLSNALKLNLIKAGTNVVAVQG